VVDPQREELLDKAVIELDYCQTAFQYLVLSKNPKGVEVATCLTAKVMPKKWLKRLKEGQ
jgi:hypothetical protein